MIKETEPGKERILRVKRIGVDKDGVYPLPGSPLEPNLNEDLGFLSNGYLGLIKNRFI